MPAETQEGLIRLRIREGTIHPQIAQMSAAGSVILSRRSAEAKPQQRRTVEGPPAETRHGRAAQRHTALLNTTPHARADREPIFQPASPTCARRVRNCGWSPAAVVKTRHEDGWNRAFLHSHPYVVIITAGKSTAALSSRRADHASFTPAAIAPV